MLVVLAAMGGCGLGLDNAGRLARGNEALENQEYRSALIDAKRVLQDEPENTAARILAGRSLLRVGDGAAAAKEFERALKFGADLSAIAVDLGRTWLLTGEFTRILDEISLDLARDDDERISLQRIHGDALRELQRFADAHDMYMEILAKRPDDVDTALAVVRTYIAEQQYSLARETLQGVLERAPDSIVGRLVSGRLWMEQNNFERAEEDFLAILEMAENSVDRSSELMAIRGLIDSNVASRDYDGAEEFVTRAMKLVPDNIPVRYLDARISYLREDWATATEKLQRLLLDAPEFAPAQLLMGSIQLNRGNYGQAEAYLVSAVTAMPENPQARKLLADARIRQNKSSDARRALQPLIGDGATDRTALAMAARASLAAGDYDQVTEFMQRRAATDPSDPNLAIDMAAAYLSVGDIEAAERTLGQLTELSGDVAYRRDLMTVVAAVRDNRLEDGLAAAMRMNTQWPQDSRILNLVGGIHAARLEVPEARSAFEKASRVNPDDLSGLVGLARIDSSEQNWDGARAHLTEALVRSADNPGLLVMLGGVEAEAGRIDQSVTWLHKAIAVDAENLAAHSMLARIHIQRGELDAAEREIGIAIEVDPTKAESHLTLGMVQAEAKKYDEAIGSVGEAVKLQPANPRYSNILARLHMLQQQPERAAEVLEQSLEATPDSFANAVMLAAVYEQAGSMDDAIDNAREWMRRRPESPGTKVMLAELLYKHDDFDESLALYDDVLHDTQDRNIALRAYGLRKSAGLPAAEKPLRDYLAVRPVDYDLRMVLSQHYQQEGRRQMAIAEYEMVAAAQPGNYVALNNLAWLYFEANDDRAKDVARRAHSIARDNVSITDTLGWILVNSGELHEGVQLLRQAASEDPQTADIKYHLAAALARAGNKEEARTILSEVLEKKEDFSSRKDAESLMADL